MERVFEAINGVFSFIGPLSDFLWEFPTNFGWYSNIPILGNISFAIILLLGSGIFFSFRIGFMQVTYFKKGIRTMTEKRVVETGISSLASFFLSSAMRVGPGNILGVTGAIAAGGPGALFWMWISAFFGMAVAYMEGVLAQIFKEKKDDEFVGGLPFYGRKLLGNKVWIGIFLSVLYILYALCCLPAQGFNVVSSVGRMAEIITAINGVFSFIGPLSDFLWEFPTNFGWYSNIPILGNISFAIILLLGSGIFFSFRIGFMQVTYFKKGIRTMTEKRVVETGISSLASFFLSSAMRVGPGNILGVTGAIAAGGPGALFWMWISAFFGMAVAYMEGVLAQIFKEKKDDEFVGGLPFYGRKLLGNKVWIGIFLSVLYILYALCCLPAQGFNVVSSVGRMAEIITGKTIVSGSAFYYIVGTIIVILTAAIAFGGIKKVSRWTDMMVPVMAVLYIVVVLLLIILNFTRIPYFFGSVFAGAFKPEAFFGGVFGTVLAQGVKRGLMSNEAGQGTITMSAAAADAKHPCEQGVIASLGVFLDTIVICTLTGFVVVMAHCWTGADAEAWQALDKLPKYTESIAVLTPGTAMNGIVTFLVTLCFCLFAFTCLLGMISFSEIAANRIRKDKICINFVRCIGLFVAGFGILCNIAGLELGNLWAFSDLGNILIVYFNVPIVYVGAKYVFRATRHYKKNDGTPFTSEIIGRNDCTYWDERAKKK